jgi:transketolase
MDIDELCINTIRMLSVDMVEKANSGHPGMPMGAAPMAYVLWTKFLKFNPRDPKWPDRDRFVLSAGHGSALLYSLLYLTGYDLSMEDIKQFRQWGGKTPGHPEYGRTPGVECTTGPLGQGFANGVGMAMAARMLEARFNRPGREIVDHYVYSIVSDGDLMEGISSEAASLAGHFKLGKLIYLYDNNQITLSGAAPLTFTEDIPARFRACGWHVQALEDGNDINAIDKAIEAARAVTDKPSLISVRTHIAYGSPHMQDTFEAHGSPLGADEVKATKEKLDWPVEPPFHVPDEALEKFRGVGGRGPDLEAAWNNKMAEYGKEFPELKSLWERMMKLEFAPDWEKNVPSFKWGAGEKPIATRAAGGKVMNALAGSIPQLVGGSADLNPSTKTALKDKGTFEPPLEGGSSVQGSVGQWSYAGANVQYGVREHAMGAITSGMALHGGFIPFAATFLIFSDYMRPAIRLACLMEIKTVYVFTHDSVALGEDGPTHQPVEHLPSLRAMPNMTVIRPADANETAEAWRAALKTDKPVSLIMTRQNLPVIDRSKYAPASGLHKGAYILAGPGAAEGDSERTKPELILIATGSEVHPALEAFETLKSEGVQARVVSMPSREIFEKQPREYRDKVLPPDVARRITIEAASPLGWREYAGPCGTIISIDHFGASAPGKVNLEKFGFTAANILDKARELLQKNLTPVTYGDRYG